MSCGDAGTPEPAPGISWELARYRARTLSDIRYDLRLEIPDSLSDRISGEAIIHFRLKEAAGPLILDFARPPEDLLSVLANSRPSSYEVLDQHIVIPGGALREGDNDLEIEFRAGDESLNRNREFLYTLFVPDRARFAFPCFDQPDLKARYRLALRVPEGWRAVSNAALEDSRSPTSLAGSGQDGNWLVFGETLPISTYLFSFAAGRFEVDSAERAGRVLRMYHRETDSLRVARNREEIFDLHASALEWLEGYTGIPYPFPKFDFVLIPSFQYGGMEHPGAILYRASRLLLDEGATENERLARASLIAHETSHMWFGDLVTMEWFDDVWMKEVFASFMAAEIANPSFPDIDHELRFLLDHYPPAYAVDRTAGANPIRQDLDNLREAGTLYGAIIYQKAPIVMRHLEDLMGREALRAGLRKYLRDFSFANASWDDLIAILDADYPDDLGAWSRVWVNEPGRPTIRAEVEYGVPADRAVQADPSHAGAGDQRIASLRVRQVDPAGRDRIWVQRLHLILRYPHTARDVDVLLEGEATTVAELSGLPRPDFILAPGAGRGYGLFKLDDTSRDYLLASTPSLPDPLTRAVSWLTLWDAMLEGEVRPVELLDLGIASLEIETVELLVERILGYLDPLYWRFLSAEERSSRGPEVESLLWSLTEGAASPGLKAVYFSAYRSLAQTDSSVRRLEDIWRGDLEPQGLVLSERDFTRLAQELALREVPGWDDILAAQQERVTNPDRRDRFAFVRPALSADPAVRDAFFESLARPENREHEPWVLEALSYLHHPLRAARSVVYVRPSLEMLEEIQASGDIFFPKRWLDATLDGHSSEVAADIVRRFLEERPGYPPRLRAKILQSADGLFRAAAIQGTR